MARSARRNNFKVGIEGAKELDKLLESMGDQAGAIIISAVKSGGEIALQAAKANTSRFADPTGNTERNITMSPVNKRKGKNVSTKRTTSGSVTIGLNRTKKGAADDAYYGAFTELGTKYQTAKFFLRDAVDKNKARIAAAIIAAFRKLKG
jgi:HK97 gp10 family phage protein